MGRDTPPLGGEEFEDCEVQQSKTHTGGFSVRMKFGVLILVTMAMLLPMNSPVRAQSKEVKDFCKELEGKTYWLKIGVLTIQRQYTVQDVTNIFPSGEVSYRGRVGKDWTEAEQTQTSTAEEFAAVVRQKTQDDIQILQKGSKVIIDYTQPKKDQLKVGIKGTGKSKGAIWFKFEGKDYTEEDIQKSLTLAFAESEADLAVTLKMGMSVEEVIELKGTPKSRVDLGTKTILIYDDMKLTFEENKLSNVE